ncbi:glycosyltransferase [Micromonospora yangpuensis]|uniref:Glycosyltransferase, MGT family n=1 Tax=Micromonospora yangpuensis TaxID=683228 RepID=A0A1C6UL60_9ACTN|nr:glycosyltransferase [Micromonospora yangpuensis]GGM17441.1 oleandomycin glycosyltransferase [Micromonospora yangpuensis]SCL54708.1 glycosyltransferase, MGT family [Micromonospora yangpuensis]
MRVALLTTTQHGHLNPYVPVVNALRRAGGEVTLLLLSADGGALDEQRRRALGGAPVHLVGQVEMAPWSGDPARIGPMLRSSPVADQTTDTLRAIAPDFVLVDSLPVTASAMVGTHASGVPYGMIWANLGGVCPREHRRGRWAYDEQVGDYLTGHGVAWSTRTHSARSSILNLMPTIPALVGHDAVTDDGVQLVGLPGAAGERGDEVAFGDLARLDPDRPVVYVSFGTIFYRRPDLLRTVIAGAVKTGAQVIAAVGDLAEELALPDEVLTAPYLPQRAVLERADVFVTHGGYNSVAESIRAATPMLVLPLAVDQPVQAYFVERAGFGTALEPTGVTEQTVADALTDLLDPAGDHLARLRAARPECGDSAARTAELVVGTVGTLPRKGQQ